MNNEIVNAMEELEKWLADPAELGRKPAKIEYTASFEDEDGIKCMINSRNLSLENGFLGSSVNPEPLVR